MGRCRSTTGWERRTSSSTWSATTDRGLVRTRAGQKLGAAVAALVMAGVCASAVAPAASAANPAIAVTTTADVVNGSDGVVSLREAVAQANATAGNDQILLAEGGSYSLTICGTDTVGPDDAVGDLDATDTATLTIQGLHGTTIHQTCPQ